MPGEGKILRKTLLYSSVLTILGLSSSAVASPWIGTIEPALHSDLTLLAEKGLLKVAVTSFPVPWKGVDHELENLDPTLLDEEAWIAYSRLRHYLQQQKSAKSLKVLTLQASSEEKRFKSFDEVSAEKGFARMSVSGDWGPLAYQISTNFAPGGERYWDQSFLAYQFGDWNLRVGALDQWWGPGQASSLILSNNARPVPGVAVSRSMATASDGLLSFLGPWYFTAQMGKLESDREVPDTRLWQSRLNFQPLNGLEIGFSWAAMWGGEGRGNSLSDFLNILTFKNECANGEEECDPALKTQAGNQLAGYDIRYSFNLFDLDMSLYGQQIGEDAVDYYKVTDKGHLYGFSVYAFGAKWFAETTNTQVSCGAKGVYFYDCYYEHSQYKSGYRYHQRAIGSTFDSDAKTVTLGMRQHFKDGDTLSVELAHLKLNPDQSRPSPVTQGKSEEVVYLKGQYQWPIDNWSLKMGLYIEHSRIDEQDSDWDADINLTASYKF
ncbi:outer membrane protein in capsule/EPS biosynthesis locus [Bowmanella pacifica]|uniref:Outer membrane protein in capsule/EPS biosynthesis locus n=2 Tax=Bowmanella TaxID=366580 RepID=A0A918DKG9_9ALTE|nr:outer membrane protein in capsule/EPS biosynthesis locus [Bowmanella pacifica]